jgi:hypothetical protein
MTLFEQEVYNTWLSTTGKYAGRPHRRRKSFIDFDETSSGIATKKISAMLARLNIVPVDFFESSYRIYEDTKHLPIEFFATYKAISNYKQWKKQTIKLKTRKDII